MLTLDLTSGMAFPKLDVGPKPERVERAKCGLAGRTFDMTNKMAAPNSLQFKAEMSPIVWFYRFMTLTPLISVAERRPE